jgi:hypothetical protein
MHDWDLHHSDFVISNNIDDVHGSPCFAGHFEEF